MLNRCIDTGLKLNPDKCFVKQEKIKFYGVICGQDGVQPDPGKVSALKQMSSPTCLLSPVFPFPLSWGYQTTWAHLSQT